MGAQVDDLVLETLAEVNDVLGSVVLSAGKDADGESAIGLWLASPTGQATGAWVLSRRASAEDQHRRRDLVRMCRGRALLSTDPALAAELWVELHELAGLPAPVSASERVVDVSRLLEDVRRLRGACEEGLSAERRESSKKFTDLSWSSEIPETPASTVDDVRTLAGLARPSGAQVVTDALAVVASLRWLISAWREAVDLRERRDYLSARVDAPAPLPYALWAAMDAR